MSSRISRKQVEKLCSLFGFNLIKHQMLGNRKNYWYLYSILDENREYIAKQVSLKEANRLLLVKCYEILDGGNNYEA